MRLHRVIQQVTNFPGTVVRTAVLLLLPAALLCLGGCAHQADSDEAITNGYFETRSGGTTYVTGSLSSADKVRDGKALKGSIKSRGVRGTPVEFEDDGAGLGIRLMAEYDRRHGISR